MLQIPGTVSNVSQTGLSRGEVKANLLLLSIIAGIKIQNIWYRKPLLPHPQWSQPLAASWNQIWKNYLTSRPWPGTALGGELGMPWAPMPFYDCSVGIPSLSQACFLVSHPTWLVLIDPDALFLTSNSWLSRCLITASCLTSPKC